MLMFKGWPLCWDCIFNCGWGESGSPETY